MKWIEWWRRLVIRRSLRPSLPRCHQLSDVLRGNRTLVPIIVTHMPRPNHRKARLLTLSTSSFIRARDGRMLVESTISGYNLSHLLGNRLRFENVPEVRLRRVGTWTDKRERGHHSQKRQGIFAGIPYRNTHRKTTLNIEQAP